MFYSETLLAKTGPLARVWLAANLERKVTKNHVLQSDIESSVHAIIDQGQAPLALRLSGQLLLGVVRIYSRKTRYLLDDCNEQIFKIKMAFKPGNVDMPANQSHLANPASLTLPDALTELDLLGPIPDPSLLLSQPWEDDVTAPNIIFDHSQHLNSSIEPPRGTATEAPHLFDDPGLILDLGEDAILPLGSEPAIEQGRDAPPSRSREDEFDDTLRDDFGLDLNGPGSVRRRESSLHFQLDEDMGDVQMGGMDDFQDANVAASAQNPREARKRSGSPLSSIRSSRERELETSVFQNDPSNIFEPDEVSAHLPQRAKKRKVIRADTETELHSTQIRALQNDRSKILKPASYLPRDPVLLTLMSMQKNGDFVSSILGDGRSRGWAPELRGVLSLEVVRESAGLKRKRDGAAAAVEERESSVPHPQIEFEQEETTISGGADDFGGDTTIGPELPAINITADNDDDHFDPAGPIDDDGYLGHGPEEDFGYTTIPILPPAEDGPISQGTKHAVHLLRERFGPSAADSPKKRLAGSVLFEDLLPETETTRADATKMFFEILVLATKDAIKVEQPENQLGGPLRLRGKRSLWGAWAEEEAGGELDAIQEDAAVEA